MLYSIHVLEGRDQYFIILIGWFLLIRKLLVPVFPNHSSNEYKNAYTIIFHLFFFSNLASAAVRIELVQRGYSIQLSREINKSLLKKFNFFRTVESILSGND